MKTSIGGSAALDIARAGTLLWDRGLSAVFGEPPRFPRASLWADGLACSAWWMAEWLGLPLGPLRALLMWFMLRGARVRISRMPTMDRFALCGIGGVFSFLSFLSKSSGQRAGRSGAEAQSDARRRLLAVQERLGNA